MLCEFKLLVETDRSERMGLDTYSREVGEINIDEIDNLSGYTLEDVTINGKKFSERKVTVIITRAGCTLYVDMPVRKFQQKRNMYIELIESMMNAEEETTSENS